MQSYNYLFWSTDLNTLWSTDAQIQSFLLTLAAHENTL